MWPTSAHPRPEDLPRVWALIDATSGRPAGAVRDADAASATTSPRTAARRWPTGRGWAIAVVGGDPIGDEAQFPELVADFAAMCHTHGWRIAVVGCSERRLELWTRRSGGRTIAAGGADRSRRRRRRRRFRHGGAQVPQPASGGAAHPQLPASPPRSSRSRNSTSELLAELTEVVRASPRGAHADRGFYMNLDGVLEGRFPGIQLIIARDASGQVQGFHRYATAGGGSDITLDVPWRRRGAPNGIDERLSVDMIMAGKDAGAQRLSLSFAAFPEIFDEKNRGRLQRIFYRLIHRPRPVDRARVVVPIRAQVPRAGRPALRAGIDDAAGSAALRVVVAGVHAAPTTPVSV